MKYIVKGIKTIYDAKTDPWTYIEECKTEIEYDNDPMLSDRQRIFIDNQSYCLNNIELTNDTKTYILYCACEVINRVETPVTKREKKKFLGLF